ncbi:COG0436 Aspartate/tyrosine/aromatic aminotransferase [Rhabdaerophilaceae bacterium]
MSEDSRQRVAFVIGQRQSGPMTSAASPRFSINARVKAVDAPPIPEAQAWKMDYSGAAGPMIDLSQAVPSTPPPEELLAALGRAAQTPDAARYGPILGDSVLRRAHAAESTRIYGGEIVEASVAITAGCNQAFVSIMMVLAGAGDTVILPAPWYFNHKMTLDMLGIGAQVLPCHAEDGFIPDIAHASALIGPRTRAIILVTPNNPTGAIYPPDVIADFGRLCHRHGLALVIDETYRDFLPAAAPPHALFSGDDWGETVVSLYSFSKAHAIPGHRLGAVIAAPALVTELAKVLDCVQICPSRTAQGVIADAIGHHREWRAAQAAELQERAMTMRHVMTGLNGWQLASAGAYFGFVAHPFPGQKAVDVARQLAVEAGVLALPGSYFGPGQETHLRFAFANVGSATLERLPERLRQLA